MRRVLVTSIIAACSAVAVYNPPNAGNALDAIEKALTQIVQSPHLTKHQLEEAKKVSSDVEKTVTELESPKGKQLSKEARAAKVTSAINELSALQKEWSKASVETVAAHKADLMKQLQAKEAELNKDQKMLKVLDLEKKLAEKKLALQKLIDLKHEKEVSASQQMSQKEAAAQQAMVANMLNLAKSLQDSKGAKNTAIEGKLKPVLTYLEGRVHNVSDSIAHLDAAEKKREGELKIAAEKTVPVKGSADAIKKGQALLNVLLKKEHRNYEKTRATLKHEQQELGGAVAAIKKGDVAGLSKVMNHMQTEMKSLEAKSHKFLY